MKFASALNKTGLEGQSDTLCKHLSLHDNASKIEFPPILIYLVSFTQSF